MQTDTATNTSSPSSLAGVPTNPHPDGLNHQHEQTSHQASFSDHKLMVDMVTLQTIAAQTPLSIPSFAPADGGPTEVQMGGMNDEGASSHDGSQASSNGGADGEAPPEGEIDERDKKRQRRLLQNRQSAALSRQRRKEYLGGLERKNNELDAENKVLKQTVYSNDSRIRELEGRLAFFIKQNEELKAILRTSDKVDEMNRLLAQAYSSLALQTAGISVPGLLTGLASFHSVEMQHHANSLSLHQPLVGGPQPTAHGMDHHQLSPSGKPDGDTGGGSTGLQTTNATPDELSAARLAAGTDDEGAASISHGAGATVVESLDGQQRQQQEELKQF